MQDSHRQDDPRPGPLPHPLPDSNTIPRKNPVPQTTSAHTLSQTSHAYRSLENTYRLSRPGPGRRLFPYPPSRTGAKEVVAHASTQPQAAPALSLAPGSIVLMDARMIQHAASIPLVSPVRAAKSDHGTSCVCDSLPIRHVGSSVVQGLPGACHSLLPCRLRTLDYLGCVCGWMSCLSVRNDGLLHESIFSLTRHCLVMPESSNSHASCSSLSFFHSTYAGMPCCLMTTLIP